jgi:hypothetical protein
MKAFKLAVVVAVLATFFGGCAALSTPFSMTPAGFNLTTKQFVYSFTRFDQTDPGAVKFQVQVEPADPANAISLPPIKVNVGKTPANGRQIVIEYFDPGQKSLSDILAGFQIGVNGVSYTGTNYRVECTYRAEGSSTKVIITVDPISTEAASLPAVSVDYGPTATGGVSILVGWGGKGVRRWSTPR